jgi:SpoIID/LytB domain protein
MRATESGTSQVEGGRRWLRRPLAVASALAVAATGLVALAPSASAEVIVRPSDGVLRVKGHGFGHGRGMSQWGAYGAATKGLTYRQILAFYYPGTTISTLPNSSITVRVTGDTDGITQVQAPISGKYGGQLQVTTGGSSTPTTLPTNLGATSWRTSTSIDGTTATLQYHSKASGTWQWENYDGLGTTIKAPITFSSTTGIVRLFLGSTYRSYRGSVSGVRYNGTHYSVVRTTMESYLQGVVPSEMPASWRTEALKAQAVAARTYAANQRATSPSSRPYQTCDSTSCQVFKGLAEYTTAGDLDATNTASSTNDAIAATSETILTYGGKPAFTEFSASNGGYSVQGYFADGTKVPYLVAKADPYDGAVPNSANSWTDSVAISTLEQKHPSIGRLSSITVDRDGHGDWGGRPDYVTLTGSTGSVKLTGSTFSSEAGFLHRWWALQTPQDVPPAPRLAGDDRYETAAAVAAKFGSNVPVAYVASSASFADALAGAARAGGLGGPVLLTKAGSLSSATAAVLKDTLRPARIVVLGGPTLISESVVAALKPLATTGDVTRVYGDDRYGTAAKVSSTSFSPGMSTVYLASGEAFPDALAGAAVAAANDAPVLLTKAGSLPAPTAAELERLQPASIVVLGGEGAISKAVEDQLAPYAHGGGVTRVWGDDRYETASAVASKLLPDATSAYVANGLLFPDALAGAALAGHKGAPVLLTKPTTLPGATAKALQDQQPSAITVLGGAGVVSTSVASALGRYIVK